MRDKWIANNLLVLTDMPGECQDKKYYLDYLMDYDFEVKIIFLSEKRDNINVSYSCVIKKKKNIKIYIIFIIFI